MNIDERDLSMALRDLANAQPPNEAPTADLITRGRRARRSRTVATTGGALALLGIVAVAAVGLVGPGGDPGSTSAQPGSTTAAVTPELRLAAAAQATAKSSFRFRVSTSRNWVDRGKTGSAKQSFEGEFDPNGPTGRLTQEFKGRIPPNGEQRIVDGNLYLARGRWRNFGKEATFRMLNDIYIPFANPATTVNPASQLEALKSVGAVTALGTAGSGESAVERYSFSYVSTPSDPDQPKRVPGKGIIEIGVKSQKISKISFNTTIDYPNWHEEAEVTWVYSDYGLDVDVKIPPVVS